MSILESFALTYKKDGLPHLVGKIMGLLYISGLATKNCTINCEI